jgi:N-sulfoglucosamine sulfohydrolase
VIKVNDQTVVDWTEPAGFVARHPPWYSERKLGAGTFALQGHDSESTVYFRNIRVRRLSE